MNTSLLSSRLRSVILILATACLGIGLLANVSGAADNGAKDKNIQATQRGSFKSKGQGSVNAVDEQCGDWQKRRERACKANSAALKKAQDSGQQFRLPSGCKLMVMAGGKETAAKTAAETKGKDTRIRCVDSNAGATGTSSARYDFACNNKGDLADSDKIVAMYRVDAKSGAETPTSKGYCVEADRVATQLGAACAPIGGSGKGFGTKYPDRDDEKSCKNGVVEFYGTPFAEGQEVAARKQGIRCLKVVTDRQAADADKARLAHKSEATYGVNDPISGLQKGRTFVCRDDQQKLEKFLAAEAAGESSPLETTAVGSNATRDTSGKPLPEGSRQLTFKPVEESSPSRGGSEERSGAAGSLGGEATGLARGERADVAPTSTDSHHAPPLDFDALKAESDAEGRHMVEALPRSHGDLGDPAFKRAMEEAAPERIVVDTPNGQAIYERGKFDWVTHTVMYTPKEFLGRPHDMLSVYVYDGQAHVSTSGMTTDTPMPPAKYRFCSAAVCR